MRSFARLSIVLAVLVAGAVAAQEKPEGKEPAGGAVGLMAARYAEIELNGPVMETLPDLYIFKPALDTLYDIKGRFAKARKDNSVNGIIVKMLNVDMGWAKAQELRRSIMECRQAGKKVICFVESPGNVEYYVASAADRVVIPPSGTVVLVGLRAEVLFLKGFLDKIGVKGDMVQVGDAKGAVEPFVQTTSSEAFKQSINKMLDDYWRQLVKGVAEGRKLDEAKVPDIINKGPYGASGAKQAGLVDDVMFYDELIDQLRKAEPRPFVLVEDYGKERPMPMAMPSGLPQLMFMMLGVSGRPPGAEMPRGPTIAVIYAVGPIVREEPEDLMMMGEFMVSAERMVRVIRKARERDNIKAIVLRIDSPGGSAEASDLIWHELYLANQAKPVIVSMSDVAASGGYYIAAGGRFIFAEEGTITGSIGVMGGKIVLKGLFDKLGLTVDVFNRGEAAGLFSMVEEFSPAERQRFTALLDETHKLFIERVSAARKRTPEQLKEMTRGQAITGTQAKEGGLVDAIGGLDEAIEAARKAAGIGPEVEVAVIHLPKPQSLWEVLLTGRYDGVRTPLPVRSSALPPALRPAAQYIATLMCLEDCRPAALMPAYITIK